MVAAGSDILVAFLNEPQEGFEFERHRKQWPLHITLVSWFRVADEIGLDTALAEVAQREQPFQAVLGDYAEFGEAGDTPVNIIAEQGALKTLHKRLSQVVMEVAADLPATPWSGDSYTAHVTRHGDGNDRSVGEVLEINSFYRVRLGAHNICRVTKRFVFGDPDEAAA